MAFAEDLSVYFNLDAPGSRTAVFEGEATLVLFDNAYLDSSGIATRDPSIHARDADVPGIAHGSAITVDGVAYRVVAIEPDGHGVSTLQLERA